MSNSSSILKFHSDPWGAFFSNNKSNGYYRYTVLNEPVDPLDPAMFIDFASWMDYGKFSQQSQYPYLNWEPSDQYSILQVLLRSFSFFLLLIFFSFLLIFFFSFLLIFFLGFFCLHHKKFRTKSRIQVCNKYRSRSISR
jgi:hypothetical protein